MWSLGVILYTLVYGSMPFESNSLVSLKQQISDGDYRQPDRPSGKSLSEHVCVVSVVHTISCLLCRFSICHVFIYIYPSIYLSIHLSSTASSLSYSASYSSACVCVCVCVSLSPSLSLSLSLSLSFCVYLLLSVCLSQSLFLNRPL